MRMIDIEYESLDLVVRFDRDDEGPQAIYAFAGQGRDGKDKYTSLDGVFTEGAEAQIFALAESKLADMLEDAGADYLEAA